MAEASKSPQMTLVCAARNIGGYSGLRAYYHQASAVIAGCMDCDEVATITCVERSKPAPEIDKQGWGSSDLCGVSGGRIEQLLP
jgi:hypothetical protein